MSETRSSLYPALLKAMRQMGPVVKNATNPAFRSKYADLGAVIEAIEGPLWDNGLLVVQRFEQPDGLALPLLITELIHAESGDRISSSVVVVSKDPNDPQKVGGAITYYRRYSLLALLGLAPEDDDGNSAAKPAPTPRQQPQEPRNAPASAALPIDMVLATLRDMDEAGDPYAEIVQYAREQGGRFDPATKERINEKVQAIAAKRRAAKPAPASIAG